MCVCARAMARGKLLIVLVLTSAMLDLSHLIQLDPDDPSQECNIIVQPDDGTIFYDEDPLVFIAVGGCTSIPQRAPTSLTVDLQGRTYTWNLPTGPGSNPHLPMYPLLNVRFPPSFHATR